MTLSLFDIADRQALELRAGYDLTEIFAAAPTLAAERGRLLRMAAAVRHTEAELAQMAFRLDRMRADLSALSQALANVLEA